MRCSDSHWTDIVRTDPARFLVYPLVMAKPSASNEKESRRATASPINMRAVPTAVTPTPMSRPTMAARNM
jgi:hypothetical protein